MKILLILLIFAFPFANTLRFTLGNSFSLLASDVILSALFVIAFPTYFKNRQELFKNKIFIAITAFVVFGCISLVLNIFSLTPLSFGISFTYLVRFIMYAQLLFIFQYVGKTFPKKYITYFSIAGFTSVVIGFIQYFAFPNLVSLFHLGWDDHLYRMFGTYFDPNFAGIMFVLYFLCVIHYFQQTQRKYLLVLALTTLIAVFLTYSRSAYLALIISGISYLILSKRVAYSLLFIGLFSICLFLVPKNLSSEGVDLFRTASITARLNSYSHALEIAQESPLYGVGFNAYRYAQISHGYEISREIPSNSGAGVSNSYLFVLATTGIVGLLLYFNFLRSIIISIKNSQHTSLLFASTIAVATQALFENTLFYPYIMIWMFLLIGIFTTKKTS